jgi:hypothetical protein
MPVGEPFPLGDDSDQLGIGDEVDGGGEVRGCLVLLVATNRADLHVANRNVHDNLVVLMRVSYSFRRGWTDRRAFLSRGSRTATVLTL